MSRGQRTGSLGHPCMAKGTAGSEMDRHRSGVRLCDLQCM